MRVQSPRTCFVRSVRMTKFSPTHLGSDAVSNQARDLLWEHTVYQVVRLFQEAEKRIRSPEGQLRYTTLRGWWRPAKARLEKEGHVRIPSETAVSEAIVEVIETLREGIILKREPAYDDLVDVDGLQFSLEAPRLRKRGIGRHAKPTDIRVYRLGSEILDLRIEAKCLVKASDIARSYLSEDGIERFSDPHEPYTDHEVGGMVAYTICGDRSYWLTKIDRGLSARVPPIPTFKRPIHTSPDETLFCRVPYSPHNGRKSEVLVFHLVLQFDSDPPVR